MDRHLGGQFPYAPFFWPAIAAASAIETASSMTAYFLGLGNDEPFENHAIATLFSPDGKEVIVVAYGKLFVYDAANGAKKREWVAPGYVLAGVAHPADPDRLMATTNGARVLAPGSIGDPATATGRTRRGALLFLVASAV